MTAKLPVKQVVSFDGVYFIRTLLILNAVDLDLYCYHCTFSRLLNWTIPPSCIHYGYKTGVQTFNSTARLMKFFAFVKNSLWKNGESV